MLRIISFFSIVIFLIINIYHYNVSYEVIKLEKKIYKIENEILDEQNPEQREAKVKEVLGNYFRPEFINRIDEKIIFDRLGEDDISKIIELQLSLIDKRLDKQGLKIKISPEVIEFISAEGYDPIYGARPLKRAIQRHLLDPLSMSLLNGEFESGDTINVSLYSGNLKFDKSSQNGGIKNSK